MSAQLSAAKVQGSLPASAANHWQQYYDREVKVVVLFGE
jgi:hypothetical protein